MAYNGAGIFSIDSDGYPVEYDTIASETVFNSITAELANAHSNAICKDGQSVIAQHIPWNAKKITNLGDATALKDALNGLTAVTNYFSYATSVGGTANAIVLVTLGGISDMTLTTGLQIWFRVNTENTSAVTINLNSLGVKNLTKAGAVALSAGDLQAGAVACIVYDGTQWQLVSPYYAEGTWSPSVGGSATYTAQVGRWTKMGRSVHIMGSITINTLGTGSPSSISGLPYTASSLANQSVSISDFASLTASVVWIGAMVGSSGAFITLRSLTAAGSSAATNSVLGNGSSITFAGMYTI